MATPNFNSCNANNFNIITYNLHGLNCGRSELYDLCNDISTQIIAVQEHWLTPKNLHLLNDIHPDFCSYGISSMSHKLSSGIYRGRPFGGVAFLWRKSIDACIEVGECDAEGRCICINLKLVGGSAITLICVYFPCSDNSPAYVAELGRCLGFLETVIQNNNDKTIILGDMNFACDNLNRGYVQCCNVLNDYNIANCDDLCRTDNCVTYVNSGLQHSSFIDHIFTSSCLRANIQDITIVDSGANLSDHRPLVASFNLAVNACSNTANPSAAPSGRKYHPWSWRWDKSNPEDFYNATGSAFQALKPPTLMSANCVSGCSDITHHAVINLYYNDIVNTLHNAALSSVVRVKCRSLKPFWSDELDSLKADSIFWHNVWISAGRPATGALYHVKTSCKYKYKLAVRNAYANYENKFDDVLYSHFLSKRQSEFWKTWHAKFRKKH